MDNKLRTVGIPSIDETPWGTHFCQFYETKDDLIDLLVPYFKTGLENNEFCLWVTSTCVDENDARRAMTETMPQFDRYVQDGRIEIVPVTDWHLKGGGVDFDQVLQGWIDKHAQALARGYDGMRVTGDVPCNIATLPKASWKDFAEYEQLLDKTVREYKMLLLCTYALDKCEATAILDVVQYHQFALIERKGTWERIESAELKRTKAELKKLNDQLETLVDERTVQLKATIDELRNEIAMRKRAEDDLRRSDDHLRLVIDTIPTMAWSVLPDGAVDFVNQRWMEYTGLSLEEALEEPTRTVHPEDLPRVMKEWFVSMAAGEPYEDEMRLRRVDGEYRWFLIRTVPLRDEHGNIVKWYGTSTDIEDRKQAEAHLQFFKHVIDQTHDPIYWLSPEQGFCFVYVNEAACRHYGYPAEALLRMSVPELDPNYPIEEYEKFWQDLKTSKSRTFETLHRRSTGEVVAVEVTSNYVTLGGKEYVAGTIRDISERKRAEEIQARFLERVISAQEEERRRIAQELHDETGQSLMFLLVGLRTIQDSRTLKEVKAQAARLRKVTSQAMKEVQRLAHGLRPSMLDDMGLGAALKRYASDFAHAHRIAAEVDTIGLAGERLPVHIETALFRIAQEALTNIVKHAAAKRVSILLNRHVSDIQMVVEDDGIGVELRSDPKSAPSSFHMGLYGMSERVSMLGGTIAIESARRKGTTIHVRIPLERNTT